MKKKFLYLFLLLLSSHIAAQDFQIKQITSGDYNACNPFINHSFGGLYSTYLYFELHWDSYSNIYAVSYDSYSQIFSDTIQITSGSFNDLNPSIDFNENLIFQTNRNGNWDIAMLPYNNGAWDEMFYLTDSSEDEIDPKIIYPADYWYYPDSSRILFKRNDDIVYMTYLNDTSNSYIVFQDDLEYTYSDYIGIMCPNYQGYFPEAGLYIIAVETDNSGFKRLVSRFRNTNGLWDAKKVLLDECDCSNPDWQEVDPFYPVLVYEDTLDNMRRLFFIETWDNETDSKLVDLPFNGNVFGFKSDLPDMITKPGVIQKPISYPYLPHTYFIENNDSSYIRLNKSDWWDNWHFPDDDTLIQINYPNSSSTIGALGYWLNSMVYYTVWGDSSDGNVHLFGRKQYINIGNVNEEDNIVDFILYQNYPNPFNPVTRIDYKIITASDVRFEVINILAQKVFVQNFGYQTAGDYSINFDGEDLVSGVYIYSIVAGESRLTKKMVLLR
ncbi:MAG: T9SS type A sorting domain-containing protein [Ignavibacteriaceae bacterium]|nr:T9SS type A sorting domain-containing protein [Ignavibacteriaceae bacterium]